MKLVFATGNTNKLREAKEILGPGLEILSFADIGFSGEIAEPWPTLEANALAKARFIFEKYGLDCFSDDSGLEVEALNGLPGVQSAFFAGPDRDSLANMHKLLSEMKAHTNRNARFRAVVALILSGREFLFEGIVKGEITDAPAGTGGFGYDPIFVPDGFSQTFGQLPGTVKNALSHRAMAMLKLKNFLQHPKSD